MNRKKRDELLKIECHARPISEYKIVYSDELDSGEYFVAMDLRYHLFYDVGADVPVVDDTEPESPYEIIIGRTNRGGAENKEGEYAIYARGTKLYVSADGLYGYVEADRYITSTLLDLVSGTDMLKEGFIYTARVESHAPKKEGNVRMLLQNIWGVDWGDQLVANRERYATSMLLSYEPDIIFVNEYWTAMRNHGRFQKGLTRNGYAEVVPENWTKPNVLPIFYKTDEWVQLECRIYDLRGEDESKTITLAVLRHIKSGRTVTCCDTHLEASWNCSYDVGNIRRINDVRLLEPILKEFLGRYPDAPFLFGADCNCVVDSTPFKKLLSLGLTDAHDTVEVRNDCCSCHGYPLYDKNLEYYVEPTPNWFGGSYRTGAIDHILFKGNLVPKAEEV